MSLLMTSKTSMCSEAGWSLAYKDLFFFSSTWTKLILRLSQQLQCAIMSRRKLLLCSPLFCSINLFCYNLDQKDAVQLVGRCCWLLHITVDKTFSNKKMNNEWKPRYSMNSLTWRHPISYRTVVPLFPLIMTLSVYDSAEVFKTLSHGKKNFHEMESCDALEPTKGLA